jgi:eukaryotic-like serine/threonine-protein kinase
MGASLERALPRIIGRYALYGPIASGGMASVHLGRFVGPGGFGRTVAIKRLHPQFAKDPEFVAMFLDEARLAARVSHPNVVPTIDILTTAGELFLVMEHVHGEALSRLLRAAQRAGQRIPLPIVSAVLSGVLSGLHAAHETRDGRGNLLNVVHRDVSPHNIIVGVDGVPRVLDFGVAKAAGRLQTTQEGQIKGKIAYMAPEQLRQTALDRTADLYAAAVVLWEMLTLERLFQSDTQAQVVAKVLAGPVPKPSEVAKGISVELDSVVARGLDRDPANRFPTGRDMATALELAIRPATTNEVAAWVTSLAADPLRRRAEEIAEIESTSDLVVGMESDARLLLAELASETDIDIADEETKSALSEKSRVGAAATDGPPNRGWRRLGFAAAALTLVGVSVGATLRFGHSDARETVAPATSTGSPPVAASATTTPPVETGQASSALPEASSVPSPAPSSAPSSVSSSGPSSHTQKPPSAPLRPTARSAAVPQPSAAPAPVQPKAASECDPPYVIDPQGDKHYKAECL